MTEAITTEIGVQFVIMKSKMLHKENTKRKAAEDTVLRIMKE